MAALSEKRPRRCVEVRRHVLDEAREASGRRRRPNAGIGEGFHRRIRMRVAAEGRSVSDITRGLWRGDLSERGAVARGRSRRQPVRERLAVAPGLTECPCQASKEAL